MSNFKKTITILMLIILIIVIPKIEFAKVENETDEEIIILGDINNDRSIDTSDLILILRHIYSTKNNKHEEWILRDNKFIAADITQNGKVDSNDTIAILRYIAAINNPEIAKNHEDWIEIKELNISEENIIEVYSIELNTEKIELKVGEKNN